MGNATKKQIEYAQQISQALNISMPNAASFEAISKFISDNQSDFYRHNDEVVHQQIVDNVRIVDYASELGFTLVRRGKYFTLKEHDSVRIDPDRNCFWRNSIGGGYGNSAYGGSVIDFAKHFSGLSMQEIMVDFSARVKGMEHEVAPSIASVKEKGEFELPPRGADMRRAYAYLIKTRYIDQDVVQDFVNQKMLYQDQRGNCVFVSYDKDKQPVFACKRGTNTEKRFVADVENSDYEHGFYINNGSEKLIVTESVIDAMSIMSILKAKGIDYKSYDYLPLAGAAKFESLMNHLHDDVTREVNLALDNDEGGIQNAEKIKELIEKEGIDLDEHDWIPDYKDWNEEIKEAFKHGKRFADIKLEKELKTPIEQKKEKSFMELAKEEAKAKLDASTTSRNKQMEMELAYDE